MEQEQLKALLLEADPIVRSRLETALRSRGYKIRLCDNSEEALEACRQDPWDFALIGENVRDMDGLEICRRIRAQSREENIVILVVPGSDQPALLQQFLEAGADDFVLKPINPAQLTMRLMAAEKLCRQRRESEESLKRAYRILSSSPAVAIVWRNSEEWPVDWASGNVAGLLGWTNEEISNRAIAYLSIIHPEDVARVQQEVAQSSSDPQAETVRHHPYRIVTRDGEVKWIGDLTVIRRGNDGNIVSYEGILLDITDRVQAQRARQQANDELEMRVHERTAELTMLKDFSEGILNNMAEGVGVVNNDGFFEFANPALATILGLDNQTLIGRSWRDVVPPNQAGVVEAARERRARGEADSYQLEMTHSNGSQIPVLISGRPRFDEHRVVGTQFVLTDLTETKKAERALIESERRYKSLYHMLRLMADNLPDMLWAKDLSGDYLFANLALCKGLLGARDSSEPIGKNDLFFATRERSHHPANPHWHDFGEMCANSDEIVIAEGKSRRFEEYGNVKGRFLFLDVFKAPMWDEKGDIVGTVGCGRDVTREQENLRLHRKVDAERLLLSTAIEQVAEGVVITDREGTIQYVNPAFERITGYSKEITIGKTPEILKSDRHDDDFYNDLWETLRAGKAWIGNFINKRADGTLYDEASAIYPVCDQAGRILNFVALKRDVTKEKLLERESQHVRRMEALGQLASGVAHDFNNILGVIQGSVDLLKQSFEQTHLLQHLDVISRSCQDSANLTQSLLGFTRQQLMAPVVLDLNEVVTKTLPMLDHLLPDEVGVLFTPATDLGVVEADRTQINQILLNLCANSRDAMPHGGTITIETGNIVIDSIYREMHPWAIEGPHIYISVTDNGEGMDQETLSRAFEPFFTTKGTRGTGLGLASAYGTVKQQGGMIDIVSKPGQGTTVFIFLPEAEAGSEPLTHQPAQEIEKKRSGTVLIAEDHADLRLVMVGLLKSLGYRVLVAKDGLEALEIVRSQPKEVSLIITDLAMPGMSGEELWHQSLKLAPDMQYLFCSGNITAWKRAPCTEAHNVRFLQKPFDIDTLADTIGDILDRE